MSHYAKVNNGIVEQVIVAEAEFFDSFVDSSPGEWIQTSYNTRGGQHYNSEGIVDGTGLRKNFAGIGYTYDYELDAFIPPQPFPSWSLDEATCLWEPPVARPADFNNNLYVWNEDNQIWDLIPS